MAKSRKARDARAVDDLSEGAGASAKLVRDSFTMPADDFALVAVLKLSLIHI